MSSAPPTIVAVTVRPFRAAHAHEPHPASTRLHLVPRERLDQAHVAPERCALLDHVIDLQKQAGEITGELDGWIIGERLDDPFAPASLELLRYCHACRATPESP